MAPPALAQGLYHPWDGHGDHGHDDYGHGDHDDHEQPKVPRLSQFNKEEDDE